MFFPRSRRVLGLVLITWALPSLLFAQDKAPTPETALKQLQEGNARFVAGKPVAKEWVKRRAELAKGQQPFAIVLTCSDSRVAPETIFDQGLGDLFVLRVAGNVTDPAVIGSIEYAVAELKAPLIVVIGHEECGAVKAALAGKELKGDLGKLIKLVHVGKDLPEDKKEALTVGIQANVTFHADILGKESEVIKDFVEAKRVQIVTGIYSLKSGEVKWQESPAKKEEKKR